VKDAAVTLALALGLGLAAPLIAAAARPSVDGPEPGHTGGFGEPTCRVCHAGNPDSTARVTLEDLPDSWTPGKPYPFEVVLRGKDLLRGGFQLSVRWADGDLRGTQAGTLAVNDERGAVTEHTNGISYAHHVAGGTTPLTPGSVRWSLIWSSPDSAVAASVAFHVAGNAANDDNSELGDIIVAGAASVRPSEVRKRGKEN
jgi:hypothetical protein